MEKMIQEENKMGVMPISKLLINMSLPIMISMLVQAFYNIVDSIYVAQINENALTAVSMAFPLQNLMIAVAAGTGVGVNALLSKSLGEKNFEKVDKTAGNAVFLAIMSYLVTLLLSLVGVGAFYRSQTSDAQIIEYGIQYASICCCFSFGVFIQVAMERLLQATGKTVYTMVVQGTGAIINIILDPIFIFGMYGCPEMGVAGAAVATITGQIIAGTMAVVLNHKVNHEVHITWKGLRPDPKTIAQIYRVGIPSIVMQSIASIMTYGMNLILMTFSSTATAVLGVYFKLQSFIFMPVFGLNNGMVPIIGFNYGARKPDRLMKTMKLATRYAVGMMIAGMAIFWAFTPQLLAIFNASEQMLAIGIPALRLISLSFLLAGFNIIRISTMQALGHGVISLTVSVMRQLVVLLPCAFIFSRIWGLSATWMAFPLAEAVALLTTVLFWKKVYRNEIKPIFDQVAASAEA